jgi:hypothetical protein
MFNRVIHLLHDLLLYEHSNWFNDRVFIGGRQSGKIIIIKRAKAR